jgi:hypothetical protein
MDTPYLVKLFKGLPYEQAIDIYENHATPEEREILQPLMDKKRDRLLKRDPERVSVGGDE